MQIIVSWNVTQCSLVDHLRRLFYLKMETTGSSEVSITIYQTTQCHTSENSNLCDHRRENLKFRINDNDSIPAYSFMSVLNIRRTQCSLRIGFRDLVQT
jgi:hypothetical protein